MRVYSCYFSPNDPFEVFEAQILLLEESLSETIGRSLIGGDFNSKSPEWGEVRLDRRGVWLAKWSLGMTSSSCMGAGNSRSDEERGGQ